MTQGQENSESYPNLTRHQIYNAPSIDYSNSDEPTQRRVLRQSTLPNPDAHSYYGNSPIKVPQTSPKQLSPQFNTQYKPEDENIMETNDQPSLPPQRSPRFQVRRQSTLPCLPIEHPQSTKYLSTSPNRTYSRSPEKSPDHPRYAQFVRQSTFPSNQSNDQYHHTKILPISPNRLSYSKSPEREIIHDQVEPKRFPMSRQATLPNPDQHMKLLPTSPPKKQLSPQFLKRSPEFSRQNTLPNPEGMNSLTMHHHGAKFLPISPRQKQNFLFPQPQSHPRPFLSQQNVPTMTEDQYSNPVISPNRDHSKMIKVRSHSNEEYTINRVPPVPTEGRRMLPEIPINRSPR